MWGKILYFEAFYSLHAVLLIAIYPLLILIVLINKIVKLLRKPFQNKNIAGQVAVITGSGRGLGRDIASELAAKGCQIAVVDIQEKLAVETAQYLAERFKVNAKAYKVDVRNFDELLQLRDSVTADLGVPTILVNNAAIVAGSSLKMDSPHEIKEMIDVNLTALCYIHQVFLPKMKELNQGYIVNIASVAALASIPLLAVYGATKAAIRSYTSAVQIECQIERKNVTLTTVMPTFLSTNKRTATAVQLCGFHHIFPLMEGEIVAKYVIDGMLSGSREITVPFIIKTLYRLLELLPVEMKETAMKFILLRNYQTIQTSSEIADVLKSKDLNLMQ